VVNTGVRPPGAPSSTAEAPSGQRPPRHWLRWVLGGIVFVLVAGASTGMILITNYQPFHAGFKQYGPPKGVGATALQIDWLDAPPNVWTYRIPSYKGLTFTYRFSIWNHGPVPITITRFGVPASEYAGSGLTVVPVAMYPDVYRSPSIGGRWVPAGPLTLEPRQEAGVEMQVRVSRCMDQGALTRWNDVPVTYKVFGIERHIFAQMNVQIDLVGTQSDC
jgi:hypothetical protein